MPVASDIVPSLRPWGETRRLALGTVQFGMRYGIANRVGQVTSQAARAMLQLAASAGIDTLDTAIAYGTSEQCLGELGVGAFRVVTKLPPLPPDASDAAAWVRTQLLGSLDRLGMQRVHGLLLHRPADLLGGRGQELLVGLRAACEDGLASRIGVSIYRPDELGPLMALHHFDLVQAPLNLIDRQLVHSGWLERLATAGAEVHVRSPFLQGLLLLPADEQARRFPRWASLWSRLEAHHRDAGGDLVAHCLAYPLSQRGVSRVVVGADSPEQLGHIIYAAAARAIDDWPEVACADAELIHPQNWSQA